MVKAHQIIDNDSSYEKEVYGEFEVGGTNWLYISDVPFGDLGFPTNLPMGKSVPENVHGFTRFTPAIFGVGAALWAGVSVYTSRRHKVAEAEGEKKHE